MIISFRDANINVIGSYNITLNFRRFRGRKLATNATDLLGLFPAIAVDITSGYPFSGLTLA